MFRVLVVYFDLKYNKNQMDRYCITYIVCILQNMTYNIRYVHSDEHFTYFYFVRKMKVHFSCNINVNMHKNATHYCFIKSTQL